MIWTFGILAFLLLLTLINKLGRGGRSHAYGLIPTAQDKQFNARLEEINQKLDGLQMQVAGLERILKEVE